MKRWPIIRHIRWFYLAWRFHGYMRVMNSLGYFANQRDLDYLDKVWKGEQ